MVLFDYAGSGRSDASAWCEERYSSLDGYARDIVEVCEELDPRDVARVGHSVSASRCARGGSGTGADIPAGNDRSFPPLHR